MVYTPPPPKYTQLQILQKQREELRKKQIEQQQKLLKMLSSPQLDNETKATLFKQLKALTASMEESLKKDSSMLQVAKPIVADPKTVLKEQLDKQLDEMAPTEDGDTREMLEDKLNSLKQKADEMIAGVPSTRGRGGLRGRGRGGRVTINRGPMSIDNRTCTIKIENPPSALLVEEALTSFYTVRNYIR